MKGGTNMKDISIPIWEKAVLTIEEASEYSNIGIGNIRKLTQLPMCSFVLYVGNKKLIKRKEFLEFLSKASRI